MRQIHFGIPDRSPNLEVKALRPNAGPVSGGTEVILEGQGIRDFGRLMKCKFGDTIVDARMFVGIGQYPALLE